MTQQDTVERILHSATVLFSERGFAETSLRTITGMAGVNLAAVNYHFGSKKGLIQAVFSRFLDPVLVKLTPELEQLEASDAKLDKTELIRLSLSAMIDSSKELGEDPQRFMRLLGLAYTQTQEHLRHFLVGRYGEGLQRLLSLMHKSQPKLSSVEFYWRLYFMLGAAVFTLSSFDAIRAILQEDFQQDTELDEALAMLVPAMAGLLDGQQRD
ncbi:TetR/AcrR family transcriptional regulator [Agaribacterium haliotis]|uniref:TetR/AcrR family transcriptional regulator n=1 Tax=Agaribacterium haliotis TaxID=2013869 RepID=UPI000BB57ACB|nr:TetR/AcrR family transcriptional regulator [Agaribacterium haliotis]